MKNKLFRWSLAALFLLLCIGFMALIYTLSSEDGYTSGQRSGQVQELVKSNVHQYMDSSELGQKFHYKIQEFIEAISPDGENWNQTIRDIAHFSLYFFLAALLYITMSIAGIRRSLKIIFSLGICFGYALFDEYHQGMVAGRVSTLQDVWIDMAGALVSLGICWIVSAFCSLFQRRVR